VSLFNALHRMSDPAATTELGKAGTIQHGITVLVFFVLFW